MIATYLLKHWEIMKENIPCIQNNEENYISFTKQVIVEKKFNKEGKEVNVRVNIYRQLEIYVFKS